MNTTETQIAQHTPGPWQISDTGVFSKHLNGHGNFYVAALPFPSEEPTPQDKSNLALIAAAPGLLAALEQAAAQFDFTVAAMAKGQTVSISSLQNCAAYARAAISKATNP